MLMFQDTGCDKFTEMSKLRIHSYITKELAILFIFYDCMYYY